MFRENSKGPECKEQNVNFELKYIPNFNYFRVQTPIRLNSNSDSLKLIAEPKELKMNLAIVLAILSCLGSFSLACSFGCNSCLNNNCQSCKSNYHWDASEYDCVTFCDGRVDSSAWAFGGRAVCKHNVVISKSTRKLLIGILVPGSFLLCVIIGVSICTCVSRRRKKRRAAAFAQSPKTFLNSAHIIDNFAMNQSHLNFSLEYDGYRQQNHFMGAGVSIHHQPHQCLHGHHHQNTNHQHHIY